MGSSAHACHQCVYVCAKCAADEHGTTQGHEALPERGSYLRGRSGVRDKGKKCGVRLARDLRPS